MCLFMFLHVFVSGKCARHRGDEAPVPRNIELKTNTEEFLLTGGTNWALMLCSSVTGLWSFYMAV